MTDTPVTKLDSVERLKDEFQRKFIAGEYTYVSDLVELALTEMWDLSRREALREAAAMVRGIEQEYIDNSKACDAAGATYSGTCDVHGALACREIADKVERLAVEEGTR
jgi:hypothetical protein